MDKSKRKQPNHRLLSCLIASLLQFGIMNAVLADFENGGFETDPPVPPPTPATAHDPIPDWTLTGYTYNGSISSTTFPSSISGINLVSPTTPGGFTDIYDALNSSNPFDYFLVDASPTPTLLLPGSGSKSVSVNFRSGHPPLAMSGDHVNHTIPTGWVLKQKQATSISQRITIQPSDIDPIDGKVHVRLIIAPVLEQAVAPTPEHKVNEQPFFAIQLTNITTGRTGFNPLFFQWNYAGQPGVPWKDLTTAGSNIGSNIDYQYTDWQTFDIAPGNAFIHVGDIIEVMVIASGCSQGGHDGHVYVDDVQTAMPSGLWVTASGPASTTPGSTITYTYTYTNSGSGTVNNVTVVANLPQGTPPLNSSGELTPVTSAQNTIYVSNTNPTTGSCSGTAPVTCSIGTLQPGQTGTFTMTVAVPGTWVTVPNTTNTSGPINNGNYPISGDGVPTLLGPLVQTTLATPPGVSNLVANSSGMPTTAVVGTPYAGSFTCANISTASATNDAPNASCEITNLPAGLAVSQCSITPTGIVWTQPANIPANQTVTCDVIGTPTTTGSFLATVSTNAANNVNSTSNIANASIVISTAASNIPTGNIGFGTGLTIPATLNGSRILNSALICCGRPVILHNLPGAGTTVYKVTKRTGNARCVIGRSKSKTYLKMKGSRGSCTIVGTQNGITTLPLTVLIPRVKKPG